MQRGIQALVRLSLLTSVLLGAGCGQHTANTPSAAAPVSNAAAPANVGSAPPFQPYTIINQPPPPPRVVTHRHRTLRLAHRGGQVFAVDHNGRSFHVGRDAQGHVYPVYTDPATHHAYPLYYDAARDRLYRVARSDDGQYYRGYVDDLDSRFYRDDRDYERITPAEMPVIVDADNNTYNTYNITEYTNYGGPYAHPLPPRRRVHHNESWLWAIPVIVSAYFVFNPPHHSPPPPRPAPVSVVVNQRNSVNVINRATIVNPRPFVVQNYPPPPVPPVRPVVAHVPVYHPARTFAATIVRPTVAAHSLAAPRPTTVVSHPHPIASAPPRVVRAAAIHSRPVLVPRPRPIVHITRARQPQPRREVVAARPRRVHLAVILPRPRPVIQVRKEHATPRLTVQRPTRRLTERPARPAAAPVVHRSPRLAVARPPQRPRTVTPRRMVRPAPHPAVRAKPTPSPKPAKVH